MIKTLLIANRGEIACRVAKTAKRMGLRIVAIYSEADANAMHVAMADVAVPIGPAPASQSYLKADTIIDAAKKTGADAIHPGYGFLSENADFAEACARQGIIFVGPKPHTIRRMGSKSVAKSLMQEAGVPVTPGYQGEDQDPSIFKKAASNIGYPVLLKAAAGGGGKGMRLVEKEGDLDAALAAAKREALSAFGDDRFLVEKYVPGPRHVEVQIFGDTHGNVVHLFERDCSVQRRHQKIIEEAPAPNLPDDVRTRFHSAAVAAAKAVDYVGAGTVEFLYDPRAGADGVYFMEMNTRLQVEHPVTEMITGFDLVEWQLEVAIGAPLPKSQDEIVALGHAFEARLYAEEADNGFAPSVGRLDRLRLPTESDAIRIDSGVREGDVVSPHYDPMIAKLVTSGGTRTEALSTLAKALTETRIAGLETNTRLLHALAEHQAFKDEDVTTHFIDDHYEVLFERPGLDRSSPDVRFLIAACLYQAKLDDERSQGGVFSELGGWRINHPKVRHFRFDIDGETKMATMETNSDNTTFIFDDDRFEVSGDATTDGAVSMVVDGVRQTAFVAETKRGLRVWIGADYIDFDAWTGLEGDVAANSAGGSLVAPMPGLVTGTPIEPGAKVSAGETLLLMEAMKMEHAIVAPSDGVVLGYRFAIGAQVGEGDLLIEFEPEVTA
ncbi:MAG: biotin carboxylase N-terminal domain-containing protein [Pseudomonadota bacterium]